MEILQLPPVPDSFYDSLGYPKEGKCADIVVISEAEAEAFYEAAAECFRMVDAATEYVIQNGLLRQMGIPAYMDAVIKRTYEDYRRHPHMIGRFDFAGGVDGVPIKLLEFNADTPFSIFEVSTVQYALAKFHGLDPDTRQYNRLFETLQDFFVYLRQQHPHASVLFTNAADGEDDVTTQIIREAAGDVMPGDYLHWTDVCIDRRQGVCSVDAGGQYIRNLYNVVIKMVPWDLLFLEDELMARELVRSMEEHPDLVVCNPPYAAIYQSKALAAVMWELFPDSPYLLRSSMRPLQTKSYVRKPIWGREGRNIAVFENGDCLAQTDGFYKNQPELFQERAQMASDGARFYQAGVFISMEEPCALGFRRSASPVITTDDELCGHILRQPS